MAQAMTWDDVLARTDLVGGVIETHEEGDRFYSPISKVCKDGDVIYFHSPWCARFNSETGEWEKWEDSDQTVSVNESFAKPVPAAVVGSFSFAMQLLGEYTIFPITANMTIDSDNIKGLPKNYERLLALYPDLPAFDRQKAEEACRSRSMDLYLETLPGLPPEATLQDFLATFMFDGSCEEFLWAYISLVTGEQDVHKKVY